MVYFVGHGATDEEGRGYLVPYDMDPARTVATAYPMQQLGSVFSTRVKARWKILLLDACHSCKVTVDSTPGKVSESLRGLPQGMFARDLASIFRGGQWPRGEDLATPRPSPGRGS